MELVWAIGAGAGLAVLAGFRVFLPLAVFMFMARAGWMWNMATGESPLAFLVNDLAIVILLVVVVIEIALTRVESLAVVERLLRLPLALVAGGLLMAAAATMPAANALDWPAWLVALPAGAVLALLGLYIHRGLVLVGEGRDPGPALDFVVLVLSVLAVTVPPAGYLYPVVALWLASRVRRLKKKKYKGLRVLA